jgi:hypothetical protein
METDIAQMISDYGFPIIAAMGMGGFIFYIWKWVTEEIDPVLGETQVTLIKLVDRVRMLDNDLIRLNMKLAMVLEYRALLDEHLPSKSKEELDDIINKYQSKSQVFNSTGKKDAAKSTPQTAAQPAPQPKPAQPTRPVSPATKGLIRK